MAALVPSLYLENFRNYQERHFEFDPVTVIVGENGSGKTSVLEALSMLSLTTSWKTEKDTEVIRWGTPFTRVLSGDHELVVQGSPYLKRLRINGVSKRTHQVIGQFPVVLFEPDELRLLHGSPHERRQYLDRLLSQTSVAYTQAVLELHQIVRQRNRLLKQINEGVAGEDELPFWDQQLNALREVMTTARAHYLQFLQDTIPAAFNEMVPESAPLTVEYIRSPRHIGESDFLSYMRENRYKELASGSSLYGPHREDFGVRWGEHPVEESMSRGQVRALLVAFKIAELEYLKTHTEKAPLLLLDDIFSELDQGRRNRLFQVFGEYQVIMTTTDLATVSQEVQRDIKVIEV